MKTGAMEAMGMRHCLDLLLSEGIEPDALITDGHIQITSIMAKDYPQIHHYYDCWHVIKGQRIYSLSVVPVSPE